MLRNFRDARVISACVVLLGGLLYWFWVANLTDAALERHEMADLAPVVMDNVELPHAELVHMYGRALKQLGQAYPDTIKTGAWTSWGFPPIRYSDVDVAEAYEVGDDTVITVAQAKLHWLRGTRSSDVGKPLIWDAIVEVVEVKYNEHATGTEFNLIFSRMGSKSRGSCPKAVRDMLTR